MPAEQAERVPHHRCLSCGGTGVETLAPHLLATWRALDDTAARTPAEVGARTGASQEATKYRLGQLAALGLARVVGTRPATPPKKCRPSAEWVRCG